MKRTHFTGLAIVLLVLLAGCGGQHETHEQAGSTAVITSETTPDNETISISGKITQTENGKDGYTATILDTSGQEYTVTISRVNLQKNGIEFKQYEAGTIINVKGTSWKDPDGKIYITAESLQ